MKKGILKSNKVVKIVTGVSLSLLLCSSIFCPKVQEFLTAKSNSQIVNQEKSAVELPANDAVLYNAEKFNLTDYLARDEQGNFIRFEAMKGVPIDVIVDEKSAWCMTDNVIQSIKNTIDAYNKVFSYINPDYQFRYITKAEYDKNQTNNPFIFITTNLSIKTNNGMARAVTSPATPETSKYNNGSIDSSSTIIISSTGTVKLTVKEIQNVVQHEISHALGFKEHSEDVYSIMNPTSNNETIQSNYFSKDVLYTLFSFYYNPYTNPHDLSEILNFIDFQDEKRHEEIDKYINATYPQPQEEKQEATQKTTQKTTQEDKKETKQELEKNNFDKYYENLKQFLKNNNLKLDNANYIVGKSFSYTNKYGQTMNFTFNEDYSYTIEVYKTNDSIKLNGRYEIQNNTIICNGEYFTVKDFKYEKTTGETSCLSLLSNGECVFATSSNNLMIETILEEELTNSLSY